MTLAEDGGERVYLGSFKFYFTMNYQPSDNLAVSLL